MNTLHSAWHQITIAPHRSLFLIGVLQSVATLLWWVFHLDGRHAIAGAAPVWAHAFLMIYTFFPFFIFGFLFTTYPNWMNADKIAPFRAVLAASLMAVGAIMFYVGLATGKPVAATGVVAILAGWAVALYSLLEVLFGARYPDKRHPVVTSIALAFGWLGAASYLLWQMTGQPIWLTAARTIGIWFFLLPVFVTVSHRMIPFFSSRVLSDYTVVRPYWILGAMLACSAGHGILQLWGVRAWLWLVDLPLAACALYLSLAWGLLRSLRTGLLAVLHIAFAWLALAMLLYSAQSLIFFISRGKWLFSLAPLHALTIGFFSSMALGMVTRVTLGHSGRKLVLDRLSWYLFLGVQTAAIVRVLADLMPYSAWTMSLYLLSGVIWLAAFTPWAIRYAPNYWRARADGQPG
ncbi:MAG TPA: NnrS family protein [Burkholderiales bacterium]|nr:NnrS family protein [Burkholderiales bacterium]